jgi:isopentenyl diphosphate isomerase/L-lactate dehydrogenase-like FMN-dependent dehydrogenase
VEEGEEPPERCPACDSSRKMYVRTSGEPAEGEPPELVGLPQTLEEVRDRARVKLKGICGVYPACDGKPERICQREAYGAHIGLGGAGSGASFRANVEALAALELRARSVGEHFEPDTRASFLGVELSFPVMGASTSGLSRYVDAIEEGDFCRATIRGCVEVGTVSWRGDTFFYTVEDNPALEACEAAGGRGIPIFKPRAQDALKRLLERAERAGVPAVGVDLDGCGSTIMAKHGQPVFRKTTKDLRELVSFTSKPFIAKGIMTAEDADRCAEAGVAAVAVSNHGGRVLDGSPGVAAVLPGIVTRVGGSVAVTADGGVRTGYDVLKMLALGADVVLVGRDVIRAAVGAGTLGVRMQMERLQQVLARAMVMTGCSSIAAVDASILT